MLVLSRKRQQAIVITGVDGLCHACRVTILEIRRGTVRLGIEVHDEVSVLRSEIENQTAVARSGVSGKQALSSSAKES